MSSFRVHHPTLRAGANMRLNYVVELPSLYEEPYDCPRCKITHIHKAIHLELDSNGDCFVHPGIWTLLQTAAGGGGLEFANELDNAPPQMVGAVEQAKLETIIADWRFYVPGKTKWESQVLVQKPLMPLLEGIAENHDRKVTRQRAQRRSIFHLGRRN